ncbi:hypothetical protein KUL97_12930 [Synechococcus sp. HK05]|uniref:hypothetical protein n=1 Tax=Synechococcus sp. HK05 TaxID=2725975 RepID=UPI001C38200F|nr:hypothetical protein [Synechococcus sp. HK05]MBV2352613.1 hypothetical protein [Synechococcus sp. HK05]
MAAALPALNPLWRNSLRTWLAASLTIGIMLWSGRSNVMMLGLLMAVLFINDNDLTPVRNIGQLVGGALIGILTAVVLHQFSSGWLVTAIGLLITGCLVRGLGLVKGVSMGYMGCWALEVIGYGKHFNWALIFDLAFTVVVGIAMAQIATWTFWPRRPLQQLPALERGLCQQLREQIERMEQWLEHGGPPPAALRSQTLLPQILQLQQLRDQRRNTPTPQHVQLLSSRWAQTGSLWRQLLRQWLLLEPLLLELTPPLEASSLLRQSLNSLDLQLQPQTATTPQAEQPSPQAWLEEARRSTISPPMILAIAQQLQQLHQLLHSRGLVRHAIEARRISAP